jgi:hypothetical protein
MAYSLKDRVNSVLMKAVADNSLRDSSNNGLSPSASTGRIVMPRTDHVFVVSGDLECQNKMEDLIKCDNIFGVEVKGSNIGPEGVIAAVIVGVPGKISIFI